MYYRNKYNNTVNRRDMKCKILFYNLNTLLNKSSTYIYDILLSFGTKMNLILMSELTVTAESVSNMLLLRGRQR